jgi:hypothetical protein
MMSIRDLEELDDSLQAMGVSNMDALQRAKALLDTAASKKKKANCESTSESHPNTPMVFHSDVPLEYHRCYIRNEDYNHDDEKEEDGEDDDDDADQEEDDAQQHSMEHIFRDQLRECHESSRMVDKFNGTFIHNSPHAIQDLGFHSPMRDIWDKRLDDLSSPSVSLATISEDGGHDSDDDDNNDDDEESFDPHDRFFVHDTMMRNISLEDDPNNIKHSKEEENEVDDDLSIEYSIDYDALVQRLKLLENTKISLLSQCSYLESKLERKTSKLIRVEEQKKELQLRLDRIEAENRDDMKDVMRKMNQMEISYQQRIAIQDARIQQLEIELSELKHEKTSVGSETSKESDSSHECNPHGITTTTTTTTTTSSSSSSSASSTSVKLKRNWLMHLK